MKVVFINGPLDGHEVEAASPYINQTIYTPVYNAEPQNDKSPSISAIYTYKVSDYNENKAFYYFTGYR